jgi:hypothetical protein
MKTFKKAQRLLVFCGFYSAIVGFSQENKKSLVPNQLILAQPRSQSSCEGTEAIFEVKAIGKNLKYQWRRGSVNLQNNSFIHGVNSRSLMFTQTKFSDSSTDYNVIVYDRNKNKETSSQISLKVDSMPRIKVSSNSPVCIGNSILLNSRYDSTYLYHWIGPNGFTSEFQNIELYNSTSILQGHYSLIVSKYGCFSNEASVIVKVVKCSTDLVLIHNVLSSKEHLENKIALEFKAQNLGPDLATGVEVEVEIPSGYKIDSSLTTIGSFNPINKTWVIGNLENLGKAKLTIHLTINHYGEPCVEATIYGNEPDPNPYNNYTYTDGVILVNSEMKTSN